MRTFNYLHTLAAILALILVADAGGQIAPKADSAIEPEPARTIAEEAVVIEKGRLSAKRRALARLATLPDPEADKILLAQFERYRSGELPPSLWIDLFEAAARRGTPALRTMLAERERELERPTDQLVRFRESLEGGDAEAGREIFTKKPEAGCIRCHAVDGKGGAIGPDLTWLRHSVDRIRILESLIIPNSTLALGFQPALLKLKSGKEISGVITFESSDDLTITSVTDGRKRKLKTIDITERTPLPSPMPPHFGAVLSKHEIRDLIEFLAVGD